MVESHAEIKTSPPARRWHWAWLLWLAVPPLLWQVTRQVPFTQVFTALSRLTLRNITVLAAANALILLLTGFCWWLILRALGCNVSLLNLIGYRLAGFGVSYLTPGPQFGGEPLQVYLLRKRHAIGSATAVASVYFDRLVELMANFIFLVAGLWVAGMIGMLSGIHGGWMWVLLPLLVFLPVGHLAALRMSRYPLTALTRWFQLKVPGEIWSKVARETSQSESQIGLFLRTRPKTLLSVLLVAGLVWVVSVAEFTWTLTFLGAHASLGQSIGILTAVRIAFLMPLPAGLGVLEGGMLIACTAAGLPAAIGLAASLVIRARDLILCLTGLWIGFWNSR